MVLVGMRWGMCSPLRIRYAPRAEILGFARVSAFFLPISTIGSTIVALQAAVRVRNNSATAAVFLILLILADEPFQLVCGLLTHVGVAMTVHV